MDAMIIKKNSFGTCHVFKYYNFRYKKIFYGIVKTTMSLEVMVCKFTFPYKKNLLSSLQFMSVCVHDKYHQGSRRKKDKYHQDLHYRNY